MKINLHDPSAWTTSSVRSLIASADDTAHRHIRVDVQGNVYVSDLPSNTDLDNVQFRLPVLCAGNDYFGAAAAGDDTWIARIHRTVQDAWNGKQSGLIVIE